MSIYMFISGAENTGGAIRAPSGRSNNYRYLPGTGGASSGRSTNYLNLPGSGGANRPPSGEQPNYRFPKRPGTRADRRCDDRSATIGAEFFFKSVSNMFHDVLSDFSDLKSPIIRFLSLRLS